MADAWKGAKEIFFRELLWLVGTVLASLLLSLGLNVLLQTSPDNYNALVQELGNSSQALQLVLFILCVLGVYVARCAAAAVGYLIGIFAAA